MTPPGILISLLLMAVPALYLLSALHAQRKPLQVAKIQWVYAMLALVVGGSALLVHLLFPQATTLAWVSSARVSFVVLAVILFLSVIIARYSQHYLAGEVDEWRYYRGLHFTLAAVTATVISNHLLLLLASWLAISLSLHQLLVFYPERPRAILAAHKKFLFARLAELSLLLAALLLFLHHGTWQIDTIVSHYPSAELSLYEQWAAVLLAVTALIKCAQLPLHGWLIQVVEAPTPVSALLHAGIINLGGYLLILFAPLLLQATVAHYLLLGVAGVSTLCASLIMLTRVSVKVRLAWSTVAQMGFMLVECALGLFDLALLHLIAHSMYKAHAFLNAGSAVQAHLLQQLSPAATRGLLPFLLALLVSTLLVAIAVYTLSPTGPYSPWLLLLLSLTLFLHEREGGASTRRWLAYSGMAILLILAYGLQKWGVSWGGSMPASSAYPIEDAVFSLLICLMFSGYFLLRYGLHTPVGNRLWKWLYAGLYLDEWATRVTLMIWPSHRQGSPNRQSALYPLTTQESPL